MSYRGSESIGRRNTDKFCAITSFPMEQTTSQAGLLNMHYSTAVDTSGCQPIHAAYYVRTSFSKNNSKRWDYAHNSDRCKKY